MPDIEVMIVAAGDPAAHHRIRAFVLENLRAFNRRRAEPPDYQRLSLAVHDAGEMVGGLVGETGWKWLYVDLLYLDTFDFQARPFYERHGYEVFGTLDDYPPGHSRFFLRKDLALQPAKPYG